MLKRAKDQHIRLWKVRIKKHTYRGLSIDIMVTAFEIRINLSTTAIRKWIWFGHSGLAKYSHTSPDKTWRDNNAIIVWSAVYIQFVCLKLIYVLWNVFKAECSTWIEENNQAVDLIVESRSHPADKVEVQALTLVMENGNSYTNIPNNRLHFGE